MANCHRSKNEDPFKASDFMWEYTPKDEVLEQTPEEVARLVDAHFTALMLRHATQPPVTSE